MAGWQGSAGRGSGTGVETPAVQLWLLATAWGLDTPCPSLLRCRRATRDASAHTRCRYFRVRPPVHERRLGDDGDACPHYLESTVSPRCCCCSSTTTASLPKDELADAPANSPIIPTMELTSFWAAHTTRYIVERWGLAGHKILELHRNVSWFQPHDGRDANTPAPRPRISALWEDRSGLLWILIVVADRHYQRNHAVLPTSSGGMTAVSPAAQHTLHDTILEVVDPRTGVLLASHRYDPSLFPVTGGGVLYIYREDEFGRPRYEFFKPLLVR
ncbi:hypothetical protein BH23GEM9_BH23GEM9_18570 [soil metagenome]